MDFSQYTNALHGFSEGKMAAFAIPNDSMSPVLNNGDIAVCKEVAVKDIIDGKIYAIKIRGNIWIKYLTVTKLSDTESIIKLESANFLEYDPFFEDAAGVEIVYKVTRVIKSY